MAVGCHRSLFRRLLAMHIACLLNKWTLLKLKASTQEQDRRGRRQGDSVVIKGQKMPAAIYYVSILFVCDCGMWRVTPAGQSSFPHSHRRTPAASSLRYLSVWRCFQKYNVVALHCVQDLGKAG